MVTKEERTRKNAGADFRNMMDRLVTHIRVGQGHEHRTSVTLLGLASELHGLDGCCTCCPRRPAGEPTAREQATAAARAAVERAVEAGVVPSRVTPVDLLLPELDAPIVSAVRAAAIESARATAADAAARLGRQW